MLNKALIITPVLVGVPGMAPDMKSSGFMFKAKP